MIQNGQPDSRPSISGYTSKPNVSESQTPWQELQRKFIGQLASGACLDFAVNYQRIAETKGVPRHSH